MALHQYNPPDLQDLRNHKALLDDFFDFYQRCDFPPTATQPNVGSGKEIPEGGRERVRGEVASFRNSESGALSQRDFGFSLCAAPEFQV